MKTFIYKTTLFIFASVVFVSLIFFSTHKMIKKKSNFTLKTPVKNVVFGHSHPTYAFNDSLIVDFKNLAQSAQSNFYSFIKVKNVLSQNDSIKTVFIEFTNNQISKIMDKWTWSNATIADRLPTYLPLMNKDEIQLLYKNNPKAFVAGSSKSFRENIINILSRKFDYTTSKIGGHKWLKGINTDSILALQATNKPTDEIDETYDESSFSYNEVSSVNLEYLEKTIKYCIDKNVKVYLIRSPQHKEFKGLRNEDEFIKIRNEKFSSIEFLDFNDFPAKNSEFADLDHLNHIGAKKFSIWFNKIMMDGLLTKENKQGFIDSEIEKFKLDDNIIQE